MHSVKPWLAHYDADVAHSIAPYPDKTLIDYLADLSRAHGDRSALLFKGASVSYGVLETQSDAFAAAVASLGVRPGDRVALILPNCPQFMIAQFGVWKAGGVVVALNPIYSERELEAALESTGAVLAIALTPFYARVKAVQGRTRLRGVIATSIKEYLPPALRLLFTVFKERKDGHRITIAAEDMWFQDLLRTHRASPKTGVNVRPDDRAVILSSGGTTGTPKGVVGTHGAYVISGMQLRIWNVAAHGADPSKDVMFVPLPLFHVYANVGSQSFAILHGAPVALVPNPRDLADLLATIRKVKPAFFNGVPTLYIALLNHPDVQSGKVDFKSIKACFCGAAPLLADTKQRFEALTGARVVEGYSLTEAMMAVCANPVMGVNKVGSVGIPLPDVRVRIFDDANGTRVMPPNEVGEIALSGRQLMVGYWNKPEETAVVMRDHADDQGSSRWLHTGDLGYLDDDGYLFIVDRKKDLIKTSGFQVWPREIEEVLAKHPSVSEVGVAGVPDATKGEAVKAWVVLRAGTTASEEELRTFCREELAPYKVPAHVEFRAELPKTMVGKVLRRALRDGG